MNGNPNHVLPTAWPDPGRLGWFAAFLPLAALILLLLAAPAAAQSGVPGAPTGLTVTDGHRALKLDWTAPTDDGGSPITGYEIDGSTGSGLIATGSTSTSYIIVHSRAIAIVVLRVRAVNANGIGPWSYDSGTVTGPATVTIAGPMVISEGTPDEEFRFILTADRPVLSTSQPLNVSVLVSETNAMIWDEDEDEGTRTVGFAVGAQTATLRVHITDDATHESDSDVTAAIQTNSDYTVGTPSSATVTVTDNDRPPGPPTGITVTPIHLNFDMSWTAPSYTGDAPIFGYEIDNSKDNPIKYYHTTTTYNGAFNSVPIAGEDYTIRVRALNTYGDGEWSDPVVVTPRYATITIAGNSPVSEGNDAVFTLTTDLVNRWSINAQDVLVANVLVSESDDMVASTNEKVHTVRFATDATTTTLTVPTVQDDMDERDSVVTAAIQASTHDSRADIYTIGTPSSATVRVANDDFGNFERRRLDTCLMDSPHSSGHGVECFHLVGSGHVRTVEGMAERGYELVSIKPVEVGDIVVAGLYGVGHRDWVIGVATEKGDDTVVTISPGTSPITEGTNATFTVTRATAGTTHLTVKVAVTETQHMIFSNGWPRYVDIPANATEATLTVLTDDDRVDEANSVITMTVSAGNGYTVGSSGSVTVTVNDNDVPFVKMLSFTSSAGADGFYALGDPIRVTVHFSASVTVTGTPELTLNVGRRYRTATYLSGSPGTALLFEYNVAAGDNDADGVSIPSGKLTLRGATINATDGGAAAWLTQRGLADQAGHKVDTPPVVLSAATRSAGDRIVLTFSEALDQRTVGSAGDFKLDVGGTRVTPVDHSFIGSAVLDLHISPAVTSGQTVTLDYTASDGDSGAPTTTNAAFQDLAGNDLADFSARAVTNNSEANTGMAQAVNPPGATVLGASAAGSSRIDLFWTTTDPISTSYDVQWSADGATWQAVDPPDAGGDTLYTHTGLTAETTYHYRVRGVNGDGPGEWSAPASATTQGDSSGSADGTQRDGSGSADGSADSSADSSDAWLAAAALTAFFDLVPAAHDGVSAFTVELHFSQEVRLSYRTVRDAVLDVTGGVVTQARRLVSGSDLGWEISVVPDADGAVELVLPVSADCGVTGAICTEDGTPLAAAVVATVPGPLDG